MQQNGQSESISFNLSALKLVRFDVADLRLRRQSIRKIARSLTLHQLQDCEDANPSIDLFSDSPDLGMRDLNEIAEHLSQSNLKSPRDLIRKACLSNSSIQLLCCQMIYSARKAFQDLLLDPLQTIEPDVTTIAKKHAHQLEAYSKFRIDALRQDRPGHFHAIDFSQQSKIEMNAIANPLTMLATIKNKTESTKINLTKTPLRCQPSSFEVFKQISEDLKNLTLKNEHIWICTRDESVGGKILKEIFAEQSDSSKIKYVKCLDRMTPLLLLSEIIKSENKDAGHFIFSWDYLDYYETVRL